MPSPTTRRRNRGRALMGGAPFTVMHLSEVGAATVNHWFRGESPNWQDEGHRNLAQRLIDLGLCTERPSTNPSLVDQTVMNLGGRGHDTQGLGVERVDVDKQHHLSTQLTVVIPVRDDSDGLAETLSMLDQTGLATIVIDDGSRIPVPPSLLPNRAILLRNEQSTGPGAARQQAMSMVQTRWVVFIDAGVRARHEVLVQLANYLALETAVGAAPRVRSIPDTHITARYDRHRSPLDMGSTASLVGPGKVVPYVPTACLMVATSVLSAAGGFDTSLRYGEDVDLVWRLGELGSVHYVPSAEVLHPARESLLGLVQQRIRYGSSAAPLALRFGSDVAPLKLPTVSYLNYLLAFTGRPWIVAATFALTVLQLARRLQSLPDALIHSILLNVKGQWSGLLSFVTATCRSWWPLALIGVLIVPAKRNQIVLALSVGLTRRLLDGPRKPVDAVTDLAVGAIDDVSYGLGVWFGAFRLRTIKPLLPARSSGQR